MKKIKHFYEKYLEKYLPYLLGALLLLGFVITRFWRVTTIPSGLHIDEIGMAYDAWSLSRYGFDRYLKSWPVYLINFGGGMNSLYCFLCAGLFKLFGYHILLVRLPGIISSFLVFVFGMLLTRKLFPENKYLPLLTGLLVVVCPYFIMAGRLGLESNLMLGFSTVFLYCLLSAIEKGTYRWYIIAGISGGLVLYTYAISYLVLLFFLICSLSYVVWVKRFSFKHWLAMAIPMGILAAPLIMVQIINIFELPEMKWGIFTITRFHFYRGSEVGMPQWNLFIQALKSIFEGDGLIYNSIPGIPNLYHITRYLFCLGLVHSLVHLGLSLRRRVWNPIALVMFWLIGMLLMGSTIGSNSNKINGSFAVVILLAVDGVRMLFMALKKYAGIIAIALSSLYLVLFLQFANYYYTGQYTAEHYPLTFFHVPVPEAIDFLNEHPEYQNKGTHMAQIGICFALSSLQSPVELGTIEDVGTYNEYWHTGSLGEIEDGYNYIVTDIYEEYADELRERGYTEIKYSNYSLFYLENR